jgi:hypothetical protein
MALKFEFRSTTRSGLQSDVAASPKGARIGHAVPSAQGDPQMAVS